MKADKIFIYPMNEPSDGYVGIAWADAHGKMDEYIRKDLLLEWAKKKQYESTTIVADNFWQEVIDKINEI